MNLLCKALILVAFLMGTLFVSAQENNKNPFTSEKEKLEKLNGTYQIEVINSRNKPYLPENLSQLIENNRDSQKTKIISLGTAVRLKVFSIAEINKADFEKKSTIIYINE